MKHSDHGKAGSSIFHEPVVRAECKGVPILGYGYAWILTQSPDLTDDARIQAANCEPLVKVAPKQS